MFGSLTFSFDASEIVSHVKHTPFWRNFNISYPPIFRLVDARFVACDTLWLIRTLASEPGEDTVASTTAGRRLKWPPKVPFQMRLRSIVFFE